MCRRSKLSFSIHRQGGGNNSFEDMPVRVWLMLTNTCGEHEKRRKRGKNGVRNGKREGGEKEGESGRQY